MKTLLTTILIISPFFLGGVKGASPAVEIFLYANDPYHPYETTEFIMTSESSVWESNIEGFMPYSNIYAWLTSDYSTLSHTALNNNTTSGGFNVFWSQHENIDNFAYGLYKLSVNDSYIYLDYRDDRIGRYIELGTPIGQQLDIWIKYNYNSDNF
jgi:hypothetical protein